ncbi:hypothetical protein V6260_09975 [Pseudoalteromonas aliena]
MSGTLNTLEQINQYLAFVIFTYNDVNITKAKVIQVPLIFFAMVVCNTLTNWTLIDGNARLSVSVGVVYGSDVILVKKLIQQVLDDHDAILVNPKSSVLFDDFADSSLVFNAIFWVCAESETMLRKVRSFGIYAVFEEHDVVIALPQRDIHIDGEIAFKRS